MSNSTEAEAPRAEITRPWRSRRPSTSFSLRHSADNEHVTGFSTRSERRSGGVPAPGRQRADRGVDLGKIGKRTGQPVNFVNNNRVDPPCGDIGKQPLQRRPIQGRAGEPAIIITHAQAHPDFVPLAGDKGLASLAELAAN
jgi:hypothetical protein